FRAGDRGVTMVKADVALTQASPPHMRRRGAGRIKKRNHARGSSLDASGQSQAVLALSSSSCIRAPAIMHDRSDVSITMSKPRFTAPAANAALAQCITHLIPA